MFKFLLFLITIFSLNTCNNSDKLVLITELPKELSENSGIVSFSDTHAWFVEDSGNKNKIYQTNFKGKITKTLEVKKRKNKDWEDLTKDNKGNVYIADTGNNENKRKDLVIYKIPNPEIEKGDKINAEAIHFYYPEQEKFPPKKTHLFYDAEAIFYYNNFLYLITKNRAHPFNGEAFVYKIPSIAGNHKAQLVDTLNFCNDWNTCQITSADLAPDGSKLVLLSYGKLFIITDFKDANFSKGKVETIDLESTNQLESVCFLNQSTLLLSDEKKGPTGRNMYSYKLK
ncbi:hypothetical protein CLV91_1222 [Maribacter vaceletii]|uniref:SdiA-regulated protein n=1 Tax=Maribacter vaceletii TaxID=1206816 RepID=A0A495EDY3_9FLAO|nr:hypothetical protein [Maribacter vaceletii]RKR15140.1 hypothetical protein CLV91_1222 [Maribacter vaceletii]